LRPSLIWLAPTDGMLRSPRTGTTTFGS
jgi:hypothetical protein